MFVTALQRLLYAYQLIVLIAYRLVWAYFIYTHLSVIFQTIESIHAVVNVICAYAPQVGSQDEQKDTFWRQMDQELREIPEGERVIVGGDLNGHVGISREAIERIHGGWGVGEKNEERERVTHFAMAFDVSIVNTFFEKRPNHLVTYKSGGRESQI